MISNAEKMAVIDEFCYQQGDCDGCKIGKDGECLAEAAEILVHKAYREIKEYKKKELVKNDFGTIKS